MVIDTWLVNSSESIIRFRKYGRTRIHRNAQYKVIVCLPCILFVPYDYNNNSSDVRTRLVSKHYLRLRSVCDDATVSLRTSTFRLVRLSCLRIHAGNRFETCRAHAGAHSGFSFERSDNVFLFSLHAIIKTIRQYYKYYINRYLYESRNIVFNETRRDRGGDRHRFYHVLLNY